MRKLSFCFGSSRQAAVWHPAQMTVGELWERLESPIRTPESTAQYHRMKKGEKDAVKDKGGFFAGKLKGTRRRKADVVSRSMITLDCDKLSPEFFEDFGTRHGYFAIVYTTHSHMPESPRARVLFPLSRDVDPEEYNAIARYLAADIGMEMVDPCSFEINQLMYWPTCCADGEYICRRYDGNWLSPDDFLSSHPHWKDCASLPVSPTEREAADRQRKAQEDPLSKSGIVGAFCRAYSVEDAMRKFLPDVYEETGDEGRWHYTPSDSIPGVVIYDGKFAYSHHASDPAYGKLLNAFDLVRIHRFGDDEPKKSFSAMSEFASRDEAVCALLLTEKRAAAARDFSGEDWTKGLQRDRNGVLANSLHNVKLILENDENLKGIVFNQLADGMEIKGGVPWKSSARFWRDADDAQLICYIDENYGTFSSRNYNIAVAKVTDDRAYHPILEFFASLPEWDGIPRADTLLVDYLGAEDSAYVRAVTRKTLCAAVARVWHPGVKFDNILVLNGAQGIGKSTLISLLGGDWYSDSLALTDMNDKTAAEKLQGYWILEIGELAGMKKADIDKVKAFISRQDDKYRASFGRRVTPHPRQCVFIGTTNSENGYLRDITGNRRFWTVKVNGQGKGSPWELSAEAIRQVWAEILIRTKAGEKLYLDAALEADARREQTSAMEQDDREGLVRAYLDLPLPDGWESMDLYRRRDYIHEPENPTNPVGTRERRIVCNMEIWCECFGKKKEDMRPCDSYAIAAIMTRLTGWEKNGICRLPLYGRQRVYKRL